MRPETHLPARILLIDDDAVTRALVAEALEPEGFRIEAAADGAAGLLAFQRGETELVLLDLMMPGMSGFECCERLRRLPGGAHVTIVVMTGSHDDDAIRRALAVGASDFISKPIAGRLLAHRLRYLLRASATLEALARSQASLSHAQALAQVGNWEYRPGARDGYWSPQLFRILGLEQDAVPANFDSLLLCVPEQQRGELLGCFMNLHAHGGAYRMEHRIRHPDGQERIVYQQAEAVQQAGQVVLLRGTLQDITQRKQQEQRTEYLANHDALTGLPNRNLLADRIGQTIARARRTGWQLATLMLDLDRFKFVNDSYSHAAGDWLLRAVAARLTLAVRDGDTVAGLGGDKFVVLLADLAQPAAAQEAAQKILATFSAPFVVDGQALHITTSIGASVFPADGDSAELLLKTAEAALYSAKGKGSNTCQFYTHTLGAMVEQRAEIEHALHQAIAKDELELYYQPKVDLGNGKVYGVEALLRWRHPRGGLIPPDRFIPLAEETGLILSIGEWVLRTACAQLRQWHARGHAGLTMAVNLSARQFRQGDVPALVRDVLASSGLEAEYLELELTESVLMHNRDTVLQALRELKKIGVTLSLDDFGTGYSSLSYLKQFPIDVVKIDQSFIRDVTNSVDGASLTKSILAMAKSLRLSTVAEGVETEGQLGFLNTHRCDAIQGYYFSRPLPAAELEALLASGRQLPAANCHPAPLHRVLLLVDDDEHILAALHRLLRRDGYQILRASSAQQALELLAIHPVGVVVSDVRMPQMAGTDLMRRVKGLYPDTVRIILSGYAELYLVTEAINEGSVYKFITKPWDDDLLREHIQESFRRFEKNVELAGAAPPPPLRCQQYGPGRPDGPIMNRQDRDAVAAPHPASQER